MSSAISPNQGKNKKNPFHNFTLPTSPSLHVWGQWSQWVSWSLAQKPHPAVLLPAQRETVAPCYLVGQWKHGFILRILNILCMKTYGYGSKPWYLEYPKVACEWMVIPPYSNNRFQFWPIPIFVNRISPGPLIRSPRCRQPSASLSCSRCVTVSRGPHVDWTVDSCGEAPDLTAQRLGIFGYLLFIPIPKKMKPS